MSEPRSNMTIRNDLGVLPLQGLELDSAPHGGRAREPRSGREETAMGVHPEPSNTRLGRAITRSRRGRVAGSQCTESLDDHLEGGLVGEIGVISP